MKLMGYVSQNKVVRSSNSVTASASMVVIIQGVY